MSPNEIEILCKKYKIENYSINSNGSIDVDGDVILIYIDLTELPLVFNNVTGYFCCNINKLTTLVGGPSSVGGTYTCSSNKLESLLGAPSVVGGNFDCSYNSLISTYSGLTDIEVGGDVYFMDCELPELIENNYINIKLILKYQRHFEIWNDDLSLNVENYQILLDEINDGLE